MDEETFIRQVADRLRCDVVSADVVTAAVFQELRRCLTEKEVAHVAAQLPSWLKSLWRGAEARLPVAKTHEPEFVRHVRDFGGLHDDAEAERAVRAVFAVLQSLLGSPTGKEGEAWHIFSVLPKDLKMLWLSASEHATG